MSPATAPSRRPRPAIPSSAEAASGSPAARSLSASRTLSSAPPVPTRLWNHSCCCISSHNAGSDWTNSVIWSHTGPAVTSTSANTDANSAANTTSDAGPRFQPRSDQGADDRIETERQHRGQEDRQQRAERQDRERDEQPDDRARSAASGRRSRPPRAVVARCHIRRAPGDSASPRRGEAGTTRVPWRACVPPSWRRCCAWPRCACGSPRPSSRLPCASPGRPSHDPRARP